MSAECCLPDGPGPARPAQRGHDGGEEGQDVTAPFTPVFDCAFGGDVPTGTNGTDTEDWAA
jgi:hypothetical protein